MKKKKLQIILEKYVYFPLIAVLVTVIVQQFLYKGNEREKYKIEVKKELLMKQHNSLEKMKRLVELDNEVSVVIFQSVFLDQNGNVFGEDKEGIRITVPTIVADTNSQIEWKKLVVEIQSNKNEIDYSLFKIFEDIVKLANKHKFPKQNKLYDIEKSGWTNADVIGRWENLNRYLEIKIKNTEELIE
jgi:hypothetical protein